MDFSTPYLTEQIIAYIGNKRKLLSLIYKAMKTTGIQLKPGLKFFDVFSGSGIVSRLAKNLQFEVYANDWEYYSYILNSCYLGCNENDIVSLFGSKENLKEQLDFINSLSSPKEKDCYISRYYGPKEEDINTVDYNTERLFYTKSNALAIDKIRNYIEKTYPLKNITEDDLKRRNILLANLLYESSTHTNTSGIFKSFHKGFGGFSKDALSRILAPIKLHQPVLINSSFPSHIYQEDANQIVRKIKGIDIAYLDPPYNQHQYGSNYHLLNSIAKWDKIPADLTLTEKGVLKEKAAIRPDWINTKSAYCSSVKAVSFFKDLIENLDAKYILISYSTDGIIDFEELTKICAKKGRLSVVTNEYTVYRGGRQSNKRKNTNIEFILCIDTTKKATKESNKALEMVFLKNKFLLLFKEHFKKSALNKIVSKQEGRKLHIPLDNNDEFLVTTDNLFKISPVENIDKYSSEKINQIIALLSPCICKTKEEELEEIFIRIHNHEKVNERLWKMIPSTLKKLAHKKNKDVFFKWLDKTKKLKKSDEPNFIKIEESLDLVEELASKRFNS